jgi:hypothetical protein
MQGTISGILSLKKTGLTRDYIGNIERGTHSVMVNNIVKIA